MFDQDKEFNHFDYEHLSKDFCYMTPVTMNLSFNNENATCQLEQELTVKNYKCTLKDHLRIERKLSNDRIFKIATGTSFLKLYYENLLPKRHVQSTEANDLAQKTNNEEKQNISAYSSVYSDRKLQNISVQFGCRLTRPQTTINANLTSFLFQHKIEYYLYSKILYTLKQWNIGFLSIFDINNKNLQTNNLVCEYKPKEQHQLFWRAQVDGLRNYSLQYKYLSSYFDFLYANYIFKPSNTLTMMAELKYDLNQTKFKYIESLIQKRFPQRTIKFKLNNSLDMTFQYNFPLSLGSGSSMDFGLKLSQLFKNPKICYGFKFNINY